MQVPYTPICIFLPTIICLQLIQHCSTNRFSPFLYSLIPISKPWFRSGSILKPNIPRKCLFYMSFGEGHMVWVLWAPKKNNLGCQCHIAVAWRSNLCHLLEAARSRAVLAIHISLLVIMCVCMYVITGVGFKIDIFLLFASSHTQP